VVVTHLLPQPASASCAAAIAAAAIAARHQPRSRTWQRFLVGSNILDCRLSSRVTTPRPPHAPVIVPLLVVSNYIGHELAPPLQLTYRIEPPHAEVDHRWYRHQCLLQSRRTTHQHFQRLQPARGRNNINLREFWDPSTGACKGRAILTPSHEPQGRRPVILANVCARPKNREGVDRRWKGHIQGAKQNISPNIVIYSPQKARRWPLPGAPTS
jgi:hypothetical protein